MFIYDQIISPTLWNTYDISF